MNNVLEPSNMNNVLEPSNLGDDPDVDDSEFVSSVHVDCSFTIPPRSEKIVLGKLKTTPVNGDVCGIIIPRSEMPRLLRFQRRARFRSEDSIRLPSQLRYSTKLGSIFRASGMKLRDLS